MDNLSALSIAKIKLASKIFLACILAVTGIILLKKEYLV